MDRNHYLDTETGEIKEYEKKEFKEEKEIKKSMKELKKLILYHFQGNKNELFITLTCKDDVTEIKVQKCLTEALEIMHDKDILPVMKYIEQKIDDEDITAMELAAAFLKLNMGEEVKDIEEIPYFEKKRRRNGGERKNGRESKGRKHGESKGRTESRKRSEKSSNVKRSERENKKEKKPVMRRDGTLRSEKDKKKKK